MRNQAGKGVDGMKDMDSMDESSPPSKDGGREPSEVLDQRPREHARQQGRGAEEGQGELHVRGRSGQHRLDRALVVVLSGEEGACDDGQY